MIEEVLSWVVQLNLRKVVVAQNLSNIILLMYCIQYLTNRKACYMCAFLLCEVGVLTGFIDHNSPAEIFSFYAMVYCYLFSYRWAMAEKLKVLCCCVIMILFDCYMILDAILYPNVYTFAWTWYADIVLAIHCLFFLSTTDFRKAFTSISSALLYVRNAYNHAFLMYNIGYILPRKY